MKTKLDGFISDDDRRMCRRHMFIPIDVVAGAEASFVIQPIAAYKISKIVIENEPAVFNILDVSVGKVSQIRIREGQTLPGELFSPFAMDLGLKFDTCQAQMNITIHVRNIINRTVRFTGWVEGRFVQPLTLDDAEYIDHQDNLHNANPAEHPDCPRCTSRRSRGV